MLYTVECSYTCPDSEADWNAFYSQQKLPALLSVSGISTSQRFRALQPGCPVYLAIHTVKDAEVLDSDEYRLKGGGNFGQWQRFISDWHRNLYQCDGPAPAIALDEILLLSQREISLLATRAAAPGLVMQAVGLDKYPPQRIAYRFPRQHLPWLSRIAGVYLYQPLGVQMHSPVRPIMP